jgi:signal transduction histidine kinase
LAIISSSSEILIRYYDKLSRQHQQEKITKIFEQVHHLSDLLDQINQLSAAEQGFLQFKPALTNVEEMCRAIISEMQDLAGENLTLESEIVLHNPEAYLDKRLMYHALTNLLGNAIKYSPGSAVVHFSVTQSGDTLFFAVKDHGIGIPEADQAGLFDPFTRASNIGEIRGTGLGLAIVKEAVDRHDGSITIDSKVGEGSLFRIEIPLQHNYQAP